MKNRKIKGVVTTLALAGSLYAASASAGPFVDTWNYNIDSGFSSYTSNALDPATGITPTDFDTNLNTPPFPAGGLPTHLQWGTTDGDQSAFRVGNDTKPVPGNVFGKINTNAAPVDTVKLFHDNFPVGEPTLVSARLYTQLAITAFAPPNPLELTNNLNFNFGFKETRNATPCVAASPAGNPCNDIFVLDVPGAGFNPIDNSLNQPFNYDGNDYIASIFIKGLTPLTDAECKEAGVSSGVCQGFTTVEGEINSFQVAFSITGEHKIPEPSVLLLFGAGLCAMGWMKSRRSQA